MIQQLVVYQNEDKFTIRNLELFRPNHFEGVSLIDVIDKTRTAMGGRLLKRWMAFPLNKKVEIQKKVQNQILAFRFQITN